jgi:hypothetical protein
VDGLDIVTYCAGVLATTVRRGSTETTRVSVVSQPVAAGVPTGHL